jgi:hypothetical protein
LGSAADFAAIAAFFIFVLLIGIDAPYGHAMPRTQKSGQAQLQRMIPNSRKSSRLGGEDKDDGGSSAALVDAARTAVRAVSPCWALRTLYMLRRYCPPTSNSAFVI